jgi:hypothetical protein
MLSKTFKIYFFKLSAIAISLQLGLLSSCKKLIDIDPPTSTITTDEVFKDSIDADAAISGLYSRMINSNGNMYFGNGAISIVTGSSADELINFRADPGALQFYLNQLSADNGQVSALFWSEAYPTIYHANACIEALEASSGIKQETKNKLISEAKFIRAFCYFYLDNMFGDVPYINSTLWAKTSLVSRSPQEEIYEKIIQDLEDAQNYLSSDYSISNGERTRANKWAAIALLSRVNLYLNKNSEAASLSTMVINNSGGLYNLTGDINAVFLTNSDEAILQWKLNTDYFPFTATTEGNKIIPRTHTSDPYYYLSNQLLNSFDSNDKRRSAWIDSTIYEGITYYFPFKYKIGPTERVVGGGASEYYMVLRLAEQYLIRAEANTQLGDFYKAAADLNLIRERAGLSDYTGSLDKDSLMTAIIHERQVELFAEWSHRWFDLKRWGIAAGVLSANKGFTVNQTALLYPIPQGELTNDPNLVQNPGY